MTHLLVVDLETGGLDPEKCAILSYCAKLLDKNLQEVFSNHGLVQPDQTLEIGAEALAVNKLSVDACRMQGISEGAMLQKIIDTINFAEGPVVWAGANPKFDRDFIQAAVQRTSYEMLPRALQRRMLDTGPLCVADTFRRTKDMDKAFECQSLPKYVKFRGWKYDLHTAEGDTNACIEIIREQFNEHLGTRA
jgi:DNA polymerase III epsilon subunit-like protein